MPIITAIKLNVFARRESTIPRITVEMIMFQMMFLLYIKQTPLRVVIYILSALRIASNTQKEIIQPRTEYFFLVIRK